MLPIPPFLLKYLAVGTIASFCAWQATSWYYDAQISDMRADKQKARAEALLRNSQVESLQLELAGAISLSDALKNRKVEVKYQTITKEVIKYIKEKADALPTNTPGCDDLPSEWVRIHDTAAGSQMSGDTTTSSSIDGSSGEVGNDKVLITVTNNYKACENNSDRLSSLQEWTRSLKTLNKKED